MGTIFLFGTDRDGTARKRRKQQRRGSGNPTCRTPPVACGTAVLVLGSIGNRIQPMLLSRHPIVGLGGLRGLVRVGDKLLWPELQSLCM
ncbi:hypothetical protein VTJ04DRAFT_4427 [Mycothermus thermophilus]|uniref:uncharacterized protein n=1 Tax=Humicola insolens TaxID=85995 RepID=UPI003741FCA8